MKKVRFVKSVGALYDSTPTEGMVLGAIALLRETGWRPEVDDLLRAQDRGMGDVVRNAFEVAEEYLRLRRAGRRTSIQSLIGRADWDWED